MKGQTLAYVSDMKFFKVTSCLPLPCHLHPCCVITLPLAITDEKLCLVMALFLMYVAGECKSVILVVACQIFQYKVGVFVRELPV